MGSTLRKFVAPEFVFGVGALELAGQYAANMGCSRVLLVSDPGVQAAGWTDAVRRSLVEVGISVELFLEVSPNPRDGEVAAGAQRFLATRCDSIVAVGGGSPMDCAKGIGIVVAHGQPIEEFEGVDEVRLPICPLICVPTTGGTAAEISQFAIITVPSRRTKIAVISKAVVPDLALVDPQTLLTKDRSLTAYTGLDALVHAFEAYVSTASSPITDLHALEAVRLIAGNLPDSVERLDDVELRARVLLGSLQAGLAFSNASLGLVHAMAHALGGLLDLPHGECNALLLPHVVDFNFESCPERYRALAEALGVRHEGRSPREALLEGLQRLSARVGVLGGLAARGVSVGDCPRLAGLAAVDPCLATNPRIPGDEEIDALYRAAL